MVLASGDVLNNQFVYMNVSADDPADPLARKFVDFTDESNIRANLLKTLKGEFDRVLLVATLPEAATACAQALEAC